MNKYLCIAIYLCLIFIPSEAKHIIIEAESFKNTGGWKIDQQFMDVMGSPYLIAHGMGEKVEDAYTDVHASSQGMYAVYVRTFNWTSPWHKGKGPGAFRLSVNGKNMERTVGQTGDKWLWEYAGMVQLRKGNNRVVLHDLTGFDGRCDAVCFLEHGKSSGETETLDSLREEQQRGNKSRSEDRYFDLVVGGGGIAGIGAAVSAARLGLKVALIQNRPILGGNNSSEVCVHLGGMIDVGMYPKLGGLLKEYAPTEEGNAMPARNYEDQRKMDIVLSEPNISLFVNTHINGIEMEGQTIKSVTAQNIITGHYIRFHAPLFADCTGDASIGYMAGADYRIGRESRREFGEALAPVVADSMTMGSSVQWYSVDTRKKSSFPIFKYGIGFHEENAEHVFKGEWTWETGMYEDQLKDFEKVRDYGLLVIYSNWSFLKNESKDKDKYKNRKLEWVAYIAGKRETRRLMGDYILSQEDLAKNVWHEDASFTTSWSIDLHHPDSINSLFFPGREFKADTKHTLIYPYAVPYRCLYSRNVNNLFMAGRNISTTHVALGTTRVMRTTAMMGEVVGMAASICHKHGVQPRQVYQKYMNELKRLMEKGIGGHNLPNNQKYNEGGRLHHPPIIR